MAIRVWRVVQRNQGSVWCSFVVSFFYTASLLGNISKFRLPSGGVSPSWQELGGTHH